MDISVHRDNQYKGIDLDIKNSMLRSVQINPTELCNRTCIFCPRHDKNIYPNQNKHIQVKTVENLCISLKKINFKNRIGFVGFGEPLLCNTLLECIRKVKEIIPDIKWLEVNTNGDKLTAEMIKDLFLAGCTHISISMYDSDKTEYFKNLKGGIPIKFIFRHHYDSNVNYNIEIVNRSEMLKEEKEEYSNNSCYIPFYKAIIDWNGDVLLCENDWSRKNIFGNVNKEDFYDIWLNNTYNNFRNGLLKGRKNKSPCKNCSVNGCKRGSEAVEIYKNHFK